MYFTLKSSFTCVLKKPSEQNSSAAAAVCISGSSARRLQKATDIQIDPVNLIYRPSPAVTPPRREENTKYEARINDDEITIILDYMLHCFPSRPRACASSLDPGGLMRTRVEEGDYTSKYVKCV